MRALADEQVWPIAHGGGDVAGHREHFASLVERQAGRDRRAAVLRAFYNNNARREPAYDAIANGEVLRIGWRTERVLAQQQAVERDPRGELPVLGRIDQVEPAAEHGDGAPLRLQRSF